MVITSSQAPLSKKVEWLLRYCQDGKPKHRAVVHVEDAEWEHVTFQPGKLLDGLKKCFLPEGKDGLVQPLDEKLRTQCLSLEWFQPWLDELNAKRQTGNDHGPPNIDEQMKMLVNSYPTVAPKKGEAVTVERVNGSSYELNGHALLEKVAPNFYGDDEQSVAKNTKYYVSPWLQQQLLVLPWSDEWLATGRKRREVARLRKLVSKDLKIELLRFFFKTKKPAWKSRIPVRVPDESGGTFDFYPGTWIDDIVDNWIGGERRSNVVLTTEQMLVISRFEWFQEWIKTVKEQREARNLTVQSAKRQQRVLKDALASDEENSPIPLQFLDCV